MKGSVSNEMALIIFLIIAVVVFGLFIGFATGLFKLPIKFVPVD